MHSDKQFIHIQVSSHIGGRWLLTACYGHHQASLRVHIWDGLRSLKQTVSDPWYVIGDFNVVMYDHEVVGGAGRA